MQDHWDVIIVGARCAGATLATLLGRRGQRVLVLEASSRGTNMPMSTHLVQPPGMAVLDRIGLGDRVRAATPTTQRMRYALDDVSVTVKFQDRATPYCVRRGTIDPWLQDSAEEAGAELRFRHRVVELIRSGERVTGVVARTPDGLQRLHADLVVGADGPHSTIAQLTAAPEYLVTEGSRAGYFAYYRAPARWEADWDATLEHIGEGLRYVFRCDGDQVILTYVGPQAEVVSWGANHRERFAEKLRESPTTSALLQGREPLGAITGLLKTRFFYRKPVGPGYALVGDAGHFKDFVTGQGMADAFIDAERLAPAILDGRDAAFVHYWRERDVATLPLHFDAISQGKVGFNEPFFRAVLARLAREPALCERMAGIFERTIDPDQLVPARILARTVISSIARGRIDALRGFVQIGRTNAGNARELGERKRLLRIAQEELQRAAPRNAREGEHERAA